MDPLAALTEWNPWWRTGSVPEVLRGRPRELTARLLLHLEVPEVLGLAGVRRSGKTTLLYQLVDAMLARGVAPERILLANLEDPALADISLDDLVRAHRQSVHPEGARLLLLDEVQARPGWEAWVNAVYERRSGVKIVVTGSASSVLEGHLATLLTGRHLTFRVHPLSFPEYLTFHDVAAPGPHATATQADAMVHHLDRYLALGGFPEANLRDAALTRPLLQQYFRDIVYRDLILGHGLDAKRVQDLAFYLAATFARPQTKRSLARAVRLAPDTVREYLTRFEEVFLILTASRFSWSPKPGPSEQAPIKTYLVDTGLRNAVAPEHARDLGRLAENLVATTLAARGARPAYWTDGKGRHEVDFVVARPGGAVEAFQVTYGQAVPERESAALLALADALPAHTRCTMRILTRAKDGVSDGIERVPLWKWLAGHERE